MSSKLSGRPLLQKNKLESDRGRHTISISNFTKHTHLPPQTHILIPTTLTYTYQYIFTHTLKLFDTYAQTYSHNHILIPPTCMYILSYTNPYTLTLVDTHTYYTLPYTLTYLHSHSFVHILSHTLAYSQLPHTHTHTVTYSDVHKYKHKDASTHIHIYTFTHTQTHVHIQNKNSLLGVKKNSLLSLFFLFPLILARSLVSVGYEGIGKARRK